MCFGKADIPGAAHTKGTNPLGNRRFNAFSQRILSGKCWRLLPATGGLKRFMLGLRSDRDGSPFVLLFRAGTVGELRTDAAIFGGELDLDDLVFPMVDGRRPTDTALSLGAERLLAFPIDEEPSSIKTLLGVGLPLDIATRRTNHFDPVLLLTADQNGSRDIARTLANVDAG